MKVLSALWGLIVDDVRLASILIVSLLISWGVSLAHQQVLAAIVIWAGLLISLWVSIEHQLRLKLKK